MNAAAMAAKTPDSRPDQMTAIAAATHNPALPQDAKPTVRIANGPTQIVVTVDVRTVPSQTIAVEGRGDRLLLFWKPGANHEQAEGFDEFIWEEVALPDDADFTQAVVSVTDTVLTLRLPKVILPVLRAR